MALVPLRGDKSKILPKMSPRNVKECEMELGLTPHCRGRSILGACTKKEEKNEKSKGIHAGQLTGALSSLF